MTFIPPATITEPVRRRQSMTIALYKARTPVKVIAWFLGVCEGTARRDLYLADVRKWGKEPALTTSKRPAYWEHHTHGGTAEVVCGRKYCSYCGRWRLLCDFDRVSDRRGKPRARCQACGRIANRYYQAHLSEEQLERRRERGRIWTTDKRRSEGARAIPQVTNVINKVEWAFLPSAPIGALLDGLSDDGIMALCARTGLGDRTLRRYVTGDSEHIRLDIADKIVVALGLSLYGVYGDTPIRHNVTNWDVAI